MIKILFAFLFSSLLLAQDSAYRLFVNKIDMPMLNNGILADVLIDGRDGGRIDNEVYLFSAGFYLAGKDGDSTWANAVASANFMKDYNPGNVDSISSNPLYKFYIINKKDVPFGTRWQEWRSAVSIGAEFYDGNNDSLYTPVDLNNNNEWDINEDAPPLIGEELVWCVYNDNTPSLERRYKDVQQKGIEIHQTVFAFKDTTTTPLEPLDYTIFIKYKLINSGKSNDVLDSVYFGLWSDTDLGEHYYDDLAGCDTLAQSGYIYNDENFDSSFGVQMPANFITLLQGPHSYIPGETFTDINSNGKFDEGIDTPVLSAYSSKGINGIDSIIGAKNLPITSFVHFNKADVRQGDPNNKTEAISYIHGKNRLGLLTDPCNWQYGIVYGGVNCTTVNPLFMYSGNPVNNYGWINTISNDQRAQLNVGPFKLEKNKPVEILTANFVARGTDYLNSVAKGSRYAHQLINFVKSNFNNFNVTDVQKNDIQPTEFYLSQNYPNPFNPTTTIRYYIPEAVNLKLEVYDVLGNLIQTLVNEQQNSGSYEVEFNSARLSTGVYFYKLQAGNFIESKKMIVLK